MSSCRKYCRSSQGGWKLCFSSFIGVTSHENSPQPLTCVCISKLLLLVICSYVHFWGYFNLSFGSRCTSPPPTAIMKPRFSSSLTCFRLFESLRQHSAVSSVTPCLHNPVDSQCLFWIFCSIWQCCSHAWFWSLSLLWHLCH